MSQNISFCLKMEDESEFSVQHLTLKFTDILDLFSLLNFLINIRGIDCTAL